MVAPSAKYHLREVLTTPVSAWPEYVVLSHVMVRSTPMGALALTGKPLMRGPFEPVPGGVQHIDTTIEALERELDDTVAALFLEPVKGEAGVIDLPDGYLRRARELCTKHGVLLIVDEVQTGAGRTGAWFGYQHSDVSHSCLHVSSHLGGRVSQHAVQQWFARSHAGAR
jgi:acetylornithine aminotransferase